MTLFMDRHYVKGATRHAIAAAHEHDLAIQGKYGIQFITYWFDEERHTSFCLVNAPSRESLKKAHDEAHGMVPNEIIEVNPEVVDAFLGRIKDPPAVAEAESQLKPIDAAFRAIMFTDMQGSTALTARLGDAQAMHYLRITNALTRNALREHDGREVKHTGDGIMASFVSVPNAVRCAIAIQRAVESYDEKNPDIPLHLRIGLSAGEPVEEDNDLFGATVQLAARLCAQAEPRQILAAQVIRELCQHEGFEIADRGTAHLKGFAQPARIYEIKW